MVIYIIKTVEVILVNVSVTYTVLFNMLIVYTETLQHTLHFLDDLRDCQLTLIFYKTADFRT